MPVEREGLALDLLDTPGHQNFSEDTYRTLTAVDNAVMVLDAAKGVHDRVTESVRCSGVDDPGLAGRLLKAAIGKLCEEMARSFRPLIRRAAFRRL